jgi:hypothetical protein
MSICREIAYIDADELSKWDAGNIAPQLALNITEKLHDGAEDEDWNAPN